jgi:hypothetical protein
MRKAWGAAMLCAVVAGCATTEALSLGNGQFMIASQGLPGNGSASGQKATALKGAAEHCAKLGKVPALVSERLVDPAFGRAPAAELIFECK